MRFAATRILGWMTLACAMSSGASAQYSPDRIPWLQDLDQARQLAARSHRLVLIHVWSDNCAPCVKLERNVFPQPEVIRAIGTHYVPVKLHAQQHPELVRRLRVNQWPTDIVMTPDGRELYRDVSQHEPNRYVMLLDQIASQHRSGVQGRGPIATQPPPRFGAGPSQQANLPYQPPAPHAGAEGDDAVRSPFGYSQQSDLVRQPGPQRDLIRQPADAPGNRHPADPGYQDPLNQPPLGRRAPVQPPYSQQYGEGPMAGPQHQEIRNPYVDQPMAGTQAAPESDEETGTAMPETHGGGPSQSDAGVDTRSWGGSRYAPPADSAAADREAASAEEELGSEPPLENARETRAAQEFDRGPERSPGGYQPSEPSLGAAAPDGRGSAVSRAESNARPRNVPGGSPVSASPAGAPPLGMEGYCPVSLVSKKRWVHGDPQWGAIHRGRLYLFPSQVEQQQFLRAPDRFAPMLSGCDVVRYFEQGEMVPGSRQFGSQLNDAVYLFADEESQLQFEANPRLYAEKMKELMQRLASRR